MDVTDLVSDSNKIYGKCDRVRSWYKYEQLKSLQRDQEDAARRLKSKSSVDKLLREGLSERRVKRRLSGQFSSCHSQSQLSKKSEFTTTSLDNFFIDLCDKETKLTGFRNSLNKESLKSHDLTDDVTRDIVDLKTKDLDEAEIMRDIEDLELYDGEMSEESFGSCDLPVEANKYKLSKYGLNADTIKSTWSKLVSYAHQIMNIHHGNCYVDYSSQFLTAVLVVDVLRMVVGRMCDILQPFVCPIQFNSDDVFLTEMKKKHTQIRINRLIEFNSASSYRSNPYDHENRQNELKSSRVLRKSLCKCRCLRRFIHNLFKLSHLVDDMLDNVADRN
ncbi:uncharacterized protein LOC121732793 [Aricia agestis]|uniref:uncharacterized protein LOC121732793 n=1 Tax=Aricia agestis TaxID=91739 RepID=UPI001C203987|nr:uncharacterized protein LOC121732793 [Aricia agestis]